MRLVTLRRKTDHHANIFRLYGGGLPALFGSIIAINAYMFLIRNVSPALATSYAYVNPVVAVLLGTGLGEKDWPLSNGWRSA